MPLNHPPHDWVWMVHPDIEGVAGPVLREAWRETHRKAGWRLCDAAAARSTQEVALLAAAEYGANPTVAREVADALLREGS